MSDFDDNMAALVDYFNAQQPVTPAAAKIKDQFATWHSQLSFYDTSVDSDTTWNQARNFRDTYERANAVTPQQQAAVSAVQQTGITSEQALNKPAAAKTSAGLYAAPTPVTTQPWIPAEYKWAAVVVIGGGALIFAYGLSAAIPAAIAGLISGSGSKKKPLSDRVAERAGYVRRT